MKILAKGDSMLPTLKDGEFYEMELLNGESICVGDIIVYCMEGLVICHRVIRVICTKSNMIFIKTKGDNCAKADPYAITMDKVLGKIKVVK